MKSRRRSDILWLMVCYAVLTLSAMVLTSETPDESDHLFYGLKIIEKGDFSKNVMAEASRMPVSVFHALPFFVYRKLKVVKAWRFADPWAGRLLGIREVPCHFAGRAATIGFGLLLLLTVFRWARRLYGDQGGLVSSALCVFCPNLLAHGIVMTNDVPVTAMMLITVYYSWGYFRNGGWGDFLKGSIALGITQLTKYSAVLLFPILCLLGVFTQAQPFWEAWRERDAKRLYRITGRFLGVVFLYLAVSLLVINTCFLFRGTCLRLRDCHFQSESFKKWQNNLKAFGNVPLPVPYDFLHGLDMTAHEATASEVLAGNPYLLGRVQEGSGRKGWGYYYLAALLLKIPTPTLVMIAMAFWLTFDGRFLNLGDEIFLWVPPLCILVFFSFFTSAQSGIRYVLPAFPFLFIWTGKLASSKVLKPFYLGVLGLWLSISTLSYYPFFASYFNESIGARKNAYLYLADTNLQFGEGTAFANRWIETHPNVSFFPGEDLKPNLMVDANFLTGVRFPSVCRWLREGYVPVGHVAYGYLLFYIPELENLTES